MLDKLGITFKGRRNIDIRFQLIKEYIEREKPGLSEDWVEVRNQIDNFLPRFQEDSKVQAIICTHSLTLIDRAPATNINVLKCDKKGNASFSFLKTNNDRDIEKFLNDMTITMGISNSSILYERCFILVEGETEEHALPIIYKTLYGTSVFEDGIKIQRINGCGNWENFVRLMGINKKDLILFLLDSDCNDPDSTCDLNTDTLKRLGFDDSFIDTKVFFIGVKEFEDAFKSSVYVEAINKCWPKQTGLPWIKPDIDSLRSLKKFSEDLLICIKRESRLKGEKCCSKPKLGMEIAKVCQDKDDIPLKIRELFAKSRQIAEVV